MIVTFHLKVKKQLQIKILISKVTFLSNSWDISSELSSDNEESETEERITESENLLHKMWRSFISRRVTRGGILISITDLFIVDKFKIAFTKKQTNKSQL